MNPLVTTASQAKALATVSEQLAEAVGAIKCHGCGCLASTLDGMERAVPAVPNLAPILIHARELVKPRTYECLGCDVCYPAAAASALVEAFPDAMPDTVLCPTEAPSERSGWPPLPGDYAVLRYSASVAVCTLNSSELAEALAKRAPDGLAIVGTMRTENLGIERLIRNVLANPNIRWLLLCGDDTRQLVGHLPGQSLESLFANGLDDEHRIVGAKGKRPFLKNLNPEHVRVLQEEVQLVSMIGEQNVARIGRALEELHAQALPAHVGTVADVGVKTVKADERQFFKSDPAGFLVVYPNARNRTLVVEHYTNAGMLDCVVEGATPTAVYCEIVKRSLVSQLDHAAYLGRELAAAERRLCTGEPYVQDRAPGVAMPTALPTLTASASGPSCTTSN